MQRKKKIEVDPPETESQEKNNMNISSDGLNLQRGRKENQISIWCRVGVRKENLGHHKLKHRTIRHCHAQVQVELHAV